MNMSESTVTSEAVTMKRKYDDMLALMGEGLADFLECVACKSIIADDFVQASCLHRACKVCWTKCMSRCPICRRLDTSARTDPLAMAILKIYPRMTLCNTPVCGSVEKHQETCIACWKVLVNEKDAEVTMVLSALETTQKKVTNLERYIDVLETAERERTSVRDSSSSSSFCASSASLAFFSSSCLFSSS